MYTVDLNCDLGESFGVYKTGMDEEIIPLISSANIACGFHAGDASIMRRTVRLCKEHGTAIGAHPGYPDLEGFGRREMAVTPQQAADYILYQTGALKGFCDAEGAKLVHVKPHGALYNRAAKDRDLALAVCRAVSSIDKELRLMGQANTEIEKAAAELGVPFIREVFADRGYLPNGLLVPRGQEGAMITDEELAIQRVVRMIVCRRVTAADGSDIPVCADSVCVHGDGEKALLFVKKIRAALTEAGIEVCSKAGSVLR